MRPDFKFRSGKYTGRTYEWVEDNDPSYLAWVKENRPEMFKEVKSVEKKEVKKEVKVIEVDVCDGAMVMNENFDNEPPDAQSIPYMLNNSDKYGEQLEKFEKHNKTLFRLIKEKHGYINRL